MASGCAVMAVCWQGPSAGVYLKSEGGAMVANSYDEILMHLNAVSENPDTVLEFSRRAYECGVKNHKKENVQKMIISDFERVIHKC